MKSLKWGVLVLAAMTWLSCVVSLLSLFDDGYLVSEPGLLGTWKVTDDADQLLNGLGGLILRRRRCRHRRHDGGR
jgi:hypothetical protein